MRSPGEVSARFGVMNVTQTDVVGHFGTSGNGVTYYRLRVYCAVEVC